MKFSTSKMLSILAIIILFACDSMRADQYVGEQECCRTSYYECGCNPLYCGAWDLQGQIGVTPILWTKRDNWLAVSPSTTPSLLDSVEAPRFSTLFKVPFIIGGQLGYAWSNNTRVFVEFNYLQASHKKDIALVALTSLANSLVVNPKKYKLFEGYVGVRYYWDRWCDSVSFFLGGKIGFTHHQKTSFNFIIGLTPPTIVTFSDISLFNANTVVSGGANFGFDFCVCGNWSFVLTGEVVASCGPDGNRNIVTTNPNLTITNWIVGHIRTELRFPVTAAVRYSF